MLEIFVDNERIDLSPDTEVSITWENPFLLQDRIPVTWAMSFELPLTKNNLAKFKNPDRVTSVGSWNKLSGYFRYAGVVFSKGKIQLKEVEKKLSTDYTGYDMPDIVKSRLSELSSIPDFFYSFGEGNRFSPKFETGWSLLYKDTIFDNAVDFGNKFAACPVRVKNEEMIDLPRTQVYLLNLYYLNMWNLDSGGYLFFKGEVPFHAAIFPQPYIHYLISLVFGDSLNENFFADNSELKNLVMLTTFNSMYADYLTSNYGGVLLDGDYYSDDNFLYLNSYFNQVTFSDFLKEILKIFCCSLIHRTDGKLDIVHNTTILDNTEIVDWNNKLTGTPKISVQKGQNYRYGYQSENTVDNEEQYRPVDDIESLIDTADEGTYQVSGTKEVFTKTEDSDNPGTYVFERKLSCLGGNSSGKSDEKEDYNISSAVKPAPMCIDKFWFDNDGLVRYPWYVAQFEGDRVDNSSSPLIGFVRGFYDKTNKLTLTADPGEGNYNNKYPLLTPYTYDPAGNSIGNYSLAWEGDDGLIAQFHADFKAYIEKNRQILKGYFRLTALDLKNVDYRNKIYVRGTMWYITKIEATFKKNSISLCYVELMEC